MENFVNMKKLFVLHYRANLQNILQYILSNGNTVSFPLIPMPRYSLSKISATVTLSSDHKLVYCSRKTSLLKTKEHCKISIRSMNNYSNEIFDEKLRSIKFPDYSNHTSVNDAYEDFIIRFLSAVNSVPLIRTLTVKSNTKPWFDIDVLNAIRNCDKHYKNSYCQAKPLLTKIISFKKNLYFEEKITENKNIPKKLWRTLKSLSMPSKEGCQSKISLKQNGVVSFNSKYNANTFYRFFSNLADSPL